MLEWRVSNVTVRPGNSYVTQADIQDLRGSAECPWITALIKQVDTSTLLAQYNAAYKDATTNFDNSMTNWDIMVKALIAQANDKLKDVNTDFEHFMTNSDIDVKALIAQANDKINNFISGAESNFDDKIKESLLAFLYCFFCADVG